jgi:hypothetical protein
VRLDRVVNEVSPKGRAHVSGELSEEFAGGGVDDAYVEFVRRRTFAPATKGQS